MTPARRPPKWPKKGPCVPARRPNRALWAFHPWSRIGQTGAERHSVARKPAARIDRTTFQNLYGKEDP